MSQRGKADRNSAAYDIEMVHHGMNQSVDGTGTVFVEMPNTHH